MNNNFSSPNRISSLIIPIMVIAGVIFLLNFVWQLINMEIYDDETITVEFHCPTVLSMKENYPTFVITECQRLKNDR
jgi:hypothetical protein